MIQYLVDNIRYPDSAKAQQIEGTIIVQFKVEADSSVTNVRCPGFGSFPHLFPFQEWAFELAYFW